MVPVILGACPFCQAFEILKLWHGNKQDTGAFGDKGKGQASLPMQSGPNGFRDRNLKLRRKGRCLRHILAFIGTITKT